MQGKETGPSDTLGPQITTGPGPKQVTGVKTSFFLPTLFSVGFAVMCCGRNPDRYSPGPASQSSKSSPHPPHSCLRMGKASVIPKTEAVQEEDLGGQWGVHQTYLVSPG